MDFNVRQKKVINAKDKNIICLAGAGSGKSIPNSTISVTLRLIPKINILFLIL